MACYVDDVRHPFGNMVMCHLWADSEAELLAMVDRIGVQRRWIQRPPRASWTHFDISLGKKAKAVAAGAIVTDRFGPSEHTAKLDIASGDPIRAERGQRMLQMIANSRAIRSTPDRPQAELAFRS